MPAVTERQARDRARPRRGVGWRAAPLTPKKILTNEEEGHAGPDGNRGRRECDILAA